MQTFFSFEDENIWELFQTKVRCPAYLIHWHYMAHRLSAMLSVVWIYSVDWNQLTKESILTSKTCLSMFHAQMDVYSDHHFQTQCYFAFLHLQLCNVNRCILEHCEFLVSSHFKLNSSSQTSTLQYFPWRLIDGWWFFCPHNDVGSVGWWFSVRWWFINTVPDHHFASISYPLQALEWHLEKMLCLWKPFLYSTFKSWTWHSFYRHMEAKQKDTCKKMLYCTRTNRDSKILSASELYQIFEKFIWPIGCFSFTFCGWP